MGAYSDMAVSAVTDPAMKSIMKVQWDCDIVIGDDKTKCMASTDCTYKPAPAAGNSTRRLLGNEGEGSGATCEASDLASMTVIAVNCPAEYKTMKAAVMADPSVPAEDKKLFDVV